MFLKSYFYLNLYFLLIGSLAMAMPHVKTRDLKTTPAEVYDSLYPTYIESCLGTQQLPYNMDAGGNFGHSYFYMRGACRDANSPYPKVKICDASDKDAGVGISVDQVFDNVNWVALPGRDFFFKGNVSDSQALDPAQLEQTIQEAIRLGVFRNVKIREEFRSFYPPQPTDEEWLAREGVGTNYALNFNRSSYCARFPMPISRLKLAVDYLNSLNFKYYSNGKYKWTPVANNCSHVVHNTLAAAGVWRFKATNAFLPIQLLNLSIPGNEFVQAERYASDHLIDDLASLYKNHLRHQQILDGWLPTQAGGTIDFVPIHSYKNTIANIDSNVDLVDIPYVGFYINHMNKYISSDVYLDLKSNLLFYKKLYAKILTSPPNIRGFAAGKPGLISLPSDFDEFYQKYLIYIQNQLNDINAKIDRL